MDRRERILRHVDLCEGVGLEIGPLDKPLVARSDASVLYVDHASTEELKEKYRDDPNVSTDGIAEVDVEWADGDLRQKLAGRGPVRWVLASHVMEHVPDPVGWLGQVAEALSPGGTLSLALPDGRFCFDAKRRTTDVSELIAAALTRRTRPTVALMYDFWARMTAVDPAEAWAGTPSGSEPDHEALGLEKCREALTSYDYQDIHCWVFTPQSFLEALSTLMRLDLVPWYSVKDLRPTERGSLEFFVALERLSFDLPDEKRRRLQEESVSRAHASLGAADTPGPVRGDGSHRLAVSEWELAMIKVKRTAMSTIRRLTKRFSEASGVR
jgi:hypothetical protein